MQVTIGRQSCIMYIRGSVEGDANGRISNAMDVVKRNQQVYVKVISVSERKLSSSMKDVDQHTGKDLLPLKKIGEEDGL